LKLIHQAFSDIWWSIQLPHRRPEHSLFAKYLRPPVVWDWDGGYYNLLRSPLKIEAEVKRRMRLLNCWLFRSFKDLWRRVLVIIWEHGLLRMKRLEHGLICLRCEAALQKWAWRLLEVYFCAFRSDGRKLSRSFLEVFPLLSWETKPHFNAI
jgi:hypothetical protein